MSKIETKSKDVAGPSGKKPRQKEPSGSPMEQLTTYLQGVRSEWGKITWPTQQQIIGQTIVVLVVVAITTLFLFVLDYSLHFIISTITPHRS